VGYNSVTDNMGLSAFF